MGTELDVWLDEVQTLMADFCMWGNTRDDLECWLDYFDLDYSPFEAFIAEYKYMVED